MSKKWLTQSDILNRITRCLNKLLAVRWDRMAEKKGHLYIFGWIDRNDSYKDFFVIDFRKGKPIDYCSSDKIYNLRYSKILNLYTQKCRRIEEVFKDVKNVVKLNK